MAKHHGYKTINIVRRPEQAAELEAIGADAVICPATCHDIPAKVKELTGGKMAIGGLDAVGGETTALITGSVANGGLVLIYGAMAGLQFTGSIVDTLFRDVTIKGFWVTPVIGRNIAQAKPVATEILDLMEKGVVVPHSGEKFPAEKISDACKASVAAARGGKVLITF
jgi:mitochondrial enoyl-[acyl-carrier protein] reductase / trans-2-enoyl-CoA reductase